MGRRRNRRRKAQGSPAMPAASAQNMELAPAQAADEAPALTIMAPRGDNDIIAIHRFMMANAADEMAEAAVDPVAYMATIYQTAQDGAALMAILDDELVGYLGLWKSRYDYSQESFLHDRGFFVLPQYRGGDVGRALLAEAKGIAQHAGLNLKIIDTNPTKARRARRGLALTAEIIGYQPQGRVFTVYPRVN